MALQAVVEDLESVPEAVRELYVEDGDKYVLSVDDIDSHPKVGSLKNAYEQEKSKRKKASTEREQLMKRAGKLLDADPELDLEDIEDERLQKAVAILKGEDAPAGDNTDLEKVKQQARKPLEKELEKYKTQAEKAESRYRQMLIDNALSEAASKANIRPALMKAFRAQFRDAVKVEDDGEGNLEVHIEDKPVPDYVSEWTQTDEGKEFVDYGGGNGGGARGGKNGGGVKSMTRAEYDKLDQAAQHKFIVGDAGVVTD